MHEKVVLLARLAALAKSQHDPDIIALGHAIETWLAHDWPAPPLEVALGVRDGPGHNWRNERSRARRDAHIRAYAEATGYSAKEVAARWKRYATTSWPRHRTLDECPAVLDANMSHLWFAMKCDPVAEPQALNPRRISSIIKSIK